MQFLPPNAAPVLVTGSFNDGDEFCGAVKGWNVEFVQLDCGEMYAGLEVSLGQNVSVQRFDLQRRFHQFGAGPDDALSFGMPDDCRRMRWYGRTIPRNSILNFSRRDGFDAVSDQDFGGYTFSTQRRALQKAMAALQPTASADQVPVMADRFDTSSTELQTMRRLVFLYHQYIEGRSGNNKAFAEFESDMLHMLAKIVCRSSAAEEPSNFAQRQLAVDRALELIMSTRDSLNVSDVYKHSAVSWRTLDRAFKERFGISPKQYIVAQRLAGVRRDLMAAPPDAKVTEIATDWGFWHLGRFASDYNRKFGELPSQTLCRS